MQEIEMFLNYGPFRAQRYYRIIAEGKDWFLTTRGIYVPKHFARKL